MEIMMVSHCKSHTVFARLPIKLGRDPRLSFRLPRSNSAVMSYHKGTLLAQRAALTFTFYSTSPRSLRFDRRGSEEGEGR